MVLMFQMKIYSDINYFPASFHLEEIICTFDLLPAEK